MAESRVLYLEVSPLPGTSQYTITTADQCQVEDEKDNMIAVKEENEETQEAKANLLKEIMGITDVDEDDPNIKRFGKKKHCVECNFITKDSDRLIRHVRKVHRGLNPFQCYMCDYSTYNKVLFEEHVRIHRGIKPFKCSYCDYCSASKKNTKKHELIHRPDNPLRCPHCPFIARHQRALVCHQKTHTGSDEDEDKKDNIEPEQLIKCEFCGDTFKTMRAINSHRRKRRKCSEPDCHSIMCSKSAFTAHMSSMHQIHDEKPKLDKPKLFQCEVCTFSVNTKARMLLHLIHHPNQTVDESVLDISILRKYGIMV
ncbi:hypothetical protein ABMA28_012486 [Loxostege sticticalis]|uniref:C2H2-type domain-containing protein n=1 Tax=Loxostege sticticalis TaxID=481309 RepID=A0ABD0S466_LOXSC